MTEVTDPTFYRTPGEAIAALPERLPSVATFDPAGQAKNAMAVIDADPSWPDFGEVAGWSELPNAGRAVTNTVRLRALLPGGPIEEHGRDAVVARFSRWFAGMDTVDLVESAGQAVADRLLIHYRLDLAQRGTRWACTQTSICKIDDGRLATIDLLCSGFREIRG